MKYLDIAAPKITPVKNTKIRVKYINNGILLSFFFKTTNLYKCSLIERKFPVQNTLAKTKLFTFLNPSNCIAQIKEITIGLISSPKNLYFTKITL